MAGYLRAFCGGEGIVDRVASKSQIKPGILVVDDDASVRETTKAALELFYPRARVETASDGVEALEKITRSRYNLVISDVEMQEMDGITLLKRTYKAYNRIGREGPDFVLMTGGTRLSFPAELEWDKLNLRKILRKPFTSEELKEAIAPYLPVLQQDG